MTGSTIIFLTVLLYWYVALEPTGHGAYARRNKSYQYSQGACQERPVCYSRVPDTEANESDDDAGQMTKIIPGRQFKHRTK